MNAKINNTIIQALTKLADVYGRLLQLYQQLVGKVSHIRRKGAARMMCEWDVVNVEEGYVADCDGEVWADVPEFCPRCGLPVGVSNARHG